MSSQTKAGDTPANVAELATHTNVLGHEDLSLIGLFGPANGLIALVRERNGSMHRVSAGNRLGSARVVGIDDSGLVLEKNGRTWRLSLPAG